MLEVKDLTKSFGSLKVLKGISFKVDKGEVLVVVGPSGCGKSTLLNLILGLLQPTRGKVDIGANKIALMAQESYKFNSRKHPFNYDETHFLLSRKTAHRGKNFK